MCALWIRRKSFNCRWEGAASVVPSSAAGAAYLTSAPATNEVGIALHRLTGLWNLEDILGHLCVLICASAAVYLFLVRFGDTESVQELYTRWVVFPLTVLIPVSFALYLPSAAAHTRIPRFEDMDPGPLFVAYWTVFMGTAIYLFVRAASVVVALRQTDKGPVPVIYMTTIAFTIIGGALLYVHAVWFRPGEPTYVRTTAWAFLYTSVAGWSVTPAYSWHKRSRPLLAPPAHWTPSEEAAHELPGAA